MNPWDGLRIALRGLSANKTRAALTILGIVIGIAAVIALVAVGQGAQAQVTGRLRDMGSNLLVVTPGVSFSRGVSRGAGTSANLSVDDVAAIAQQGTLVATVAPEYSVGGVQAAYGSANTRTSLLGVSPPYLAVRNWRVAQGRFIAEDDLSNIAQVCVLGAGVAQDLGVSPASALLGQEIKLNRQNYTVVGLLAVKGQSGITNQDDQIFIPLTTAQLRFGGPGTRRVSAINVQAKSAEMVALAEAEVTAILRARHGLAPGGTSQFRVSNQVEMLEAVEETTGAFTVLLGSIAAISLLVGGIGIMNIMLVSVIERTREIGIRRAVGARSRDVLGQFLIESTMLGSLGGVLGIVVGYFSAQGLPHLVEGYTTLISPASMVLAFCVSLAIGLFFGVVPAVRAARLTPVEALRHE